MEVNIVAIYTGGNHNEPADELESFNCRQECQKWTIRHKHNYEWILGLFSIKFQIHYFITSIHSSIFFFPSVKCVSKIKHRGEDLYKLLLVLRTEVYIVSTTASSVKDKFSHSQLIRLSSILYRLCYKSQVKWCTQLLLFVNCKT